MGGGLITGCLFLSKVDKSIPGPIPGGGGGGGLNAAVYGTALKTLPFKSERL